MALSVKKKNDDSTTLFKLALDSELTGSRDIRSFEQSNVSRVFKEVSFLPS